MDTQAGGEDPMTRIARLHALLCMLTVSSCSGRPVASDTALADAQHAEVSRRDIRDRDIPRSGDLARSCVAINDAYLKYVDEAKHCDARIPTTKCDYRVRDSLCGGCDILVDPTHVSAIQQLASLEQQWNALGCAAMVDCPMPKCRNPTGATCPYGGVGDCFGGCCENTYQ
jgi:hypothetical protein